MMNATKFAGVYPSLVETVNINGDFEFKEKQTDNSVLAAPHCTTNVSNPEPNIGFNVDQLSDKSSEAAHIHAPIPKHCSTERRTSALKQPRILDCYAECNNTMRGKTAGESYWINLDQTKIDLQHDRTRTVIKELEEEIDDFHGQGIEAG